MTHWLSEIRHHIDIDLYWNPIRESWLGFEPCRVWLICLLEAMKDLTSLSLQLLGDFTMMFRLVYAKIIYHAHHTKPRDFNNAPTTRYSRLHITSWPMLRRRLYFTSIFFPFDRIDSASTITHEIILRELRSCRQWHWRKVSPIAQKMPPRSLTILQLCLLSRPIQLFW